MNPYDEVVLGQAMENAQIAEATAEQQNASNRKYKGGYAARNRAAAKDARQAARNGRQLPARFEGPVGGPWYRNPAWWIAGVAVIMLFQKR